MPPRSSRPSGPGNYRRLEGSELKPRPPIEHLAAAEPAESVKVTIVVRRRTDGPAIPDHAYYAKTPPSKRRRLPPEEFASKYGAADDDLAAVRRFAESHGLEVLDSNAARRSIVVSGTVAQFNETFAITLNTYRHQVRRSQLDTEPRAETFRSYDGSVSVPEDLANVIVGVFGLDNRRITKRSAGDPPGTGLLTVDKVRTLYDFPQNQAAGQTIAIFSEGGYLPSDISANFAGSPPAVIDVPVNASKADSLTEKQRKTFALRARPRRAPRSPSTSRRMTRWAGSTWSPGSCTPLPVIRYARCSRRASSSPVGTTPPRWRRKASPRRG